LTCQKENGLSDHISSSPERVLLPIVNPGKTLFFPKALSVPVLAGTD
jgi:hypothetical protein